MANLNLYEEVNYERILARKQADYQARQPSWRPAETDPALLLLQAAAGDEALSRLYFNQRGYGAFLDTALDADLRALAETLGVDPASKPTEALRREVKIKVAAEGRAGTPSAYRAFALAASDDVKDAITSISAAPNAGRVDVSVLAVESATNAGSLNGTPTAALVTEVQNYLRDDMRRDVRDDDLIASAAAPTEYRIAVALTPSTPNTRALAQMIIYDYIDEHLIFDTTLYPTNLVTALESNDAIDQAALTVFNVSPYTGVATLTATGVNVYSAQKNATGVAIS